MKELIEWSLCLKSERNWVDRILFLFEKMRKVESEKYFARNTWKVFIKEFLFRECDEEDKAKEDSIVKSKKQLNKLMILHDEKF